MKKDSNPKIYFGRPVNLYDTPLEKKIIRKIQAVFSQYTLEDPHQQVHQEGYARCKAEREDKDGMFYFLFEVIPKMSAGIFVPFEDGNFGSGVYREAEQLRKYTNQVFEINLEGIISALILDPERKLSVEATRERVYRKK